MANNFERGITNVLYTSFHHDQEKIIEYFHIRLAREHHELSTLLMKRENKEVAQHAEFAGIVHMMQQLVEAGYKTRAIDESRFGSVLKQGMMLSVDFMESMAFEDGLSQSQLREEMFTGQRMTRDFSIDEEQDLGEVLRAIADAIVRRGTDRYEALEDNLGYKRIVELIIASEQMDEDDTEAFRAGFGHFFGPGLEILAKLQAKQELEAQLANHAMASGEVDEELALLVEQSRYRNTGESQ